MRAAQTEEISHMLFSNGRRSLMSMFATHPPLVDRIRALDPSFDEEEFKKPLPGKQGPAMPTDHPAVQGLAGGADAASMEQPDIVDSVGHPTAQHVVYAMALRKSLPTRLYDAAHSNELSLFLGLAIILNPDGQRREHQLSFLQDKLGANRARIVREFNDDLAEIGARFRLPLLAIALPAIRQRPPSQLTFLLKNARKLIEADNHVDLNEFCIYRVLQSQLQPLSDLPNDKPRTSKSSERAAMTNVIGAVSAYGNESAEGIREAFLSGMQLLALPADGSRYSVTDPKSIDQLEASLDALVDLKFDDKERLLQALNAAILRDGRVSIEEHELMRAICASIDCPLPPYLEQAAISSEPRA
jgi:hypothetical protein